MELRAREQHKHRRYSEAKATRYSTLQLKEAKRIDSRKGQSHCPGTVNAGNEVYEKLNVPNTWSSYFEWRGRNKLATRATA